MVTRLVGAHAVSCNRPVCSRQRAEGHGPRAYHPRSEYEGCPSAADSPKRITVVNLWAYQSSRSLSASEKSTSSRAVRLSDGLPNETVVPAAPVLSTTVLHKPGSTATSVPEALSCSSPFHCDGRPRPGERRASIASSWRQRYQGNGAQQGRRHHSGSRRTLTRSCAPSTATRSPSMSTCFPTSSGPNAGVVGC